MDETLKINEAAEFLKINVQTLRRYVREGKVEASRMGKSYVFKSSDLEDFFERNKNIK